MYICNEYYPKSFLGLTHNELVDELRANIIYKLWLIILYDNEKEEFYINIDNKWILDNKLKSTEETGNIIVTLIDMLNDLIVEEYKVKIFSYNYIRYDLWEKMIKTKRYSLREENYKQNDIYSILNEHLILKNNKYYNQFILLSDSLQEDVLRSTDYERFIKKSKINKKTLCELIQSDLDTEMRFIK